MTGATSDDKGKSIEHEGGGPGETTPLEDTVAETDGHEPLFDQQLSPGLRYSVSVPESETPLRFSAFNPIPASLFSGVLDMGSGFTLSPIDSITLSSKEQELAETITRLRRERSDLLQQLSDRQRTEEERSQMVRDIEAKNRDLERHSRLAHLTYRVKESARLRLATSDDFARMFEEADRCDSFILSIDIRRSTDLMLNAREPELYSRFIVGLCDDLGSAILDNYGVFDKFTGDGILAFFPDFYSGLDAGYLAIKAASECHRRFDMHYRRCREYFSPVLLDTGLGIGIDFGRVKLARVRDGLTAIGTPVVYACRLSSARAGLTVLNQQAYEAAARKYGGYVDFEEMEQEIKHQGRILAHVARLSDKVYVPQLPDWERQTDAPNGGSSQDK